MNWGAFFWGLWFLPSDEHIWTSPQYLQVFWLICVLLLLFICSLCVYIYLVLKLLFSASLSLICGGTGAWISRSNTCKFKEYDVHWKQRKTYMVNLNEKFISPILLGLKTPQLCLWQHTLNPCMAYVCCFCFQRARGCECNFKVWSSKVSLLEYHWKI